MQRSLAAVAALVAAGLVLGGCPSKPKYPECKGDDDCKEQKEVCIEGFCKQCRDDKQCQEGFVCSKDHSCVPKPQCAKKEDCPTGQKCSTDGKCIAECTPATAEKDCGAGKKCLANGACGGPDDCSGDADCKDGNVCIDGKCGVKKITCNADEDCPEGSACVNGICAAGVARKVKCEMKTVHFDFDKANIKPGERSAIDQDVQCLAKQAAKKVMVEGHADERGTTEYNIALGSRRAEAVKRYLKTAAPDVEVETTSFGKEKPVDPGHDESAWSKNRRAELVPEK